MRYNVMIKLRRIAGNALQLLQRHSLKLGQRRGRVGEARHGRAGTALLLPAPFAFECGRNVLSPTARERETAVGGGGEAVARYDAEDSVHMPAIRVRRACSCGDARANLRMSVYAREPAFVSDSTVVVQHDAPHTSNPRKGARRTLRLRTRVKH